MARIKRNKQKNNAVIRVMVFLVFAMLLSAGPGMTAQAYPLLDPGKGTELTVKTCYDDIALQGMEVWIYRIGSIDEYAILSLDAPYEGEFNISDPQSRSEWDQVAKQMAAFCSRQKLSPLMTGKTNQNGTVRFGENLSLSSGVYLVLGKELDYNGYRYTTLPFLVSLPNWNVETGVWEYSVQAFPKIDREPLEAPPGPGPPNPPNPPKPPGPPVKPSPTNSKLPQTGLLWWPIPPLLFAGILLITAGMLQRKSS